MAFLSSDCLQIAIEKFYDSAVLYYNEGGCLLIQYAGKTHPLTSISDLWSLHVSPL